MAVSCGMTSSTEAAMQPWLVLVIHRLVLSCTCFCVPKLHPRWKFQLCSCRTVHDSYSLLNLLITTPADVQVWLWKAPLRSLRLTNGERNIPITCCICSTCNYVRYRSETSSSLERVRTPCTQVCYIFRGALPLTPAALRKVAVDCNSGYCRCNTHFRSRTRKRSNQMA